MLAAKKTDVYSTYGARINAKSPFGTVFDTGTPTPAETVAAEYTPSSEDELLNMLLAQDDSAAGIEELINLLRG
jgi:hypothetical protein